MDMRQLFNDFKKHVESLDDEAIRRSITRAVEHSNDSSSIECEAEKKNGGYVKSFMQSPMLSNDTYVVSMLTGSSGRVPIILPTINSASSFENK